MKQLPLFHRAADHWRRHAVAYQRGAALFALVAIAIAQPILDVVSHSPEFFAARSTSRTTAVAAVLVICVGLPCVLFAVERVMAAISRRAAATFLIIVVGLLSAAVMMPLLRRVESIVWPWEVVVSGLVGLGLAVGYVRNRIVRQFFTALSAAAVIVPVVFFVDPAVAQTFLTSESAVAVERVNRTPPIVFVVFDELPLNSLLNGKGELDGERYPNIAAFAQGASWFRNASTVASTTSHAVPAILSGRYPVAPDAVPTLRFHPVNLFTALARHYDIFASLRFQKLCPPRACRYNSAMPADTVESLIYDLAIVWLHIVLPENLTEELPPVTEDWADFGRTRQMPGEVRQSRHRAFGEFLSLIDGQPGKLHFIHLVLPHMPFEYVPSGRRYRGPDHGTHVYRRAGLFARTSAAYADTLHQRHLAQVGYVDRLIGDLIRRLREVGVYDQALIVITADHGASYRERRSRRQVQQRNVSDILGVPLFIKVPDQQRGEVVDRIVETVDIFPTVLNVVDATGSLRLDGRSLVDASLPGRSSHTVIMRTRARTARRTYRDLSADRAESLARKERRFGHGPMTGIFAPPVARHLLGRSVKQLPVAAQPDVQVTIRNPAQFEHVNLNLETLPLYVGGVLTTSRSAPLTLAVAVNGTVAAVTQSYKERDAQMFGTLIPESSLRTGANAVTVVAVDTPAATSGNKDSR